MDAYNQINLSFGQKIFQHIIGGGGGELTRTQPAPFFSNFFKAVIAGINGSSIDLIIKPPGIGIVAYFIGPRCPGPPSIMVG